MVVEIWGLLEYSFSLLLSVYCAFRPSSVSPYHCVYAVLKLCNAEKVLPQAVLFSCLFHAPGYVNSLTTPWATTTLAYHTQFTWRRGLTLYRSGTMFPTPVTFIEALIHHQCVSTFVCHLHWFSDLCKLANFNSKTPLVSDTSRPVHQIYVVKIVVVRCNLPKFCDSVMIGMTRCNRR